MSLEFLVNNLFVLIAGLLTFTMTIAVGLLEVGELGETLSFSLLKTILMTGAALLVMAAVGLNTAFAPTLWGIIGNPVYGPGLFLNGFSTSHAIPGGDVWWSSTGGLTTGAFFLYETATAAVTLALVGVIFLRKVKLTAIGLFSLVYFVFIWNLPVAWIWNPGGWLAKLGMVDFAGGIIVHGAAGAAGLGICFQIWREERARGHPTSPAQPVRISPTWLAFALLLLWMGWFGFNSGAVLAFNEAAILVVITTFLCGASALFSLLLTAYLVEGIRPDTMWSSNGVLMGLIIVTPLAGLVSPMTAVLLGLVGGPLFYYAQRFTGSRRWFTDPVGLFPGHLVGGVFGISMIAFVAQSDYASASGITLPNGLLFGGGLAAVHQLGIELLGVVAVAAFVFTVSFGVMRGISWGLGGILQSAPAKVPGEPTATPTPGVFGSLLEPGAAAGRETISR